MDENVNYPVTPEEEIVVEDFYNRHYIRTNESGLITHGYSDAFEIPKDGDICINEQGGYQFRLWPEGEENPGLMTMDGLYLYRWDGEKVVALTEEEIEAQRPVPTPAEQRESAYNTERLIVWENDLLTVTQAAQLWQYYAAEKSEKADELTVRIAEAKSTIRAMYPDGNN